MVQEFGVWPRRGIFGTGGGASVDILLTLQTTSVTPTTFDPSLTLSGGAPAFVWDFGDGNTDNTVNPSHTYVSAGTKTVTLSPSALGPFVTVFNAGVDNLISNIPSFSTFTALTVLQLNANQLTGSIPDFSANTVLSTLYLNANQLTGSIPDFSANTVLSTLWLMLNQLSDIEPGSLATPKLNDARFQDNGMSQAIVDKIIDQIYTYRANYTAATPSLNIGGTNAAPSGNYTDPAVTPGTGASNSDWSWNGTGHDPLTGKAKIYDLVNDVRSETFNTWTVTFTA